MSYFGFDAFDVDFTDYADSYSLLHDYQKRTITGKKEDYNYEYDLFPKDFTYSKNFNGRPSNPAASRMDKLHTESYLTNKIKNIERVYVGSDEAPEEVTREILPQARTYMPRDAPSGCNCHECREKVTQEYLHKNDINLAIEELQKKNDILTLLLVFIVIYCLVQLFYPRGYSAITETSTVIAKPKTGGETDSSAAVPAENKEMSVVSS